MNIFTIWLLILVGIGMGMIIWILREPKGTDAAKSLTAEELSEIMPDRSPLACPASRSDEADLYPKMKKKDEPLGSCRSPLASPDLWKAIEAADREYRERYPDTPAWWEEEE